MEDVKIKKKKRFLKSYRMNLKKISRLESKVSRLDERLTSIRSPNLSGMPRGGIPVSKDELISDKEDLLDRIKRLKDKGRKIKRDIEREIDSLEDPRYCDILEYYFIDCLSMDQTAEEIGYSVRYTYELYSEAISILAENEQ